MKVFIITQDNEIFCPGKTNRWFNKTYIFRTKEEAEEYAQRHNWQAFTKVKEYAVLELNKTE